MTDIEAIIAKVMRKVSDQALARAFAGETTTNTVLVDPPPLDLGAMLATIEAAKAAIFDVTGLRPDKENRRALENALLYGTSFPPEAYAGIRIIEDPYCLKETEERLFPASKNRSRRIHKKLVKRHGGEFRKVPAMFGIGRNTLVCHPAIRANLKEMPW